MQIATHWQRWLVLALILGSQLLILKGPHWMVRQYACVIYADMPQEMGVTQPVLLDDGEIGAKRYRVRGLPTTVFIHPDGMIEDVVVGGPMSEAFLEEKVNSILP